MSYKMWIRSIIRVEVWVEEYETRHYDTTLRRLMQKKEESTEALSSTFHLPSPFPEERERTTRMVLVWSSTKAGGWRKPWSQSLHSRGRFTVREKDRGTSRRRFPENEDIQVEEQLNQQVVINDFSDKNVVVKLSDVNSIWVKGNHEPRLKTKSQDKSTR